MIGILDWGIGGIGFYRALKLLSPHVGVRYLSDAGATPYGKLSRRALLDRVTRAANVLASLGATHLAIACNAASTIVDRETMIRGLPVTGVIPHATRLVNRAIPHHVGVIGGTRTIRSGIYRRALARRGRTVSQRVAQVLSARIEAGDLASAALDSELQHILAPLADVDALLLACTHYPAIADRIATFLPRARLLDPAAEMADWVAHAWPMKRGDDRFFTTGDCAAMKRAAACAFGVAIARVERMKMP